MTQKDYDAQWVCAYCDTTYVVPSLARLCEDKHEALEEEEVEGDEA